MVSSDFDYSSAQCGCPGEGRPLAESLDLMRSAQLLDLYTKSLCPVTMTQIDINPCILGHPKAVALGDASRAEQARAGQSGPG